MCSNKNKIIQYSTNGKILKMWENIVDISIENPTYRTNHIHRVCKSNGGRKYDKYLWKYFENENINDRILIKDKYKNVLQYNLNGVFIKEWYDSKEVDKVLGIDAVLQCCKKNEKRNIKYKYKDYMWYFKNNDKIKTIIKPYNMNPSIGVSKLEKRKIKKFSLDNIFIDIYTVRQLKTLGFLTKTIYRCCNNELNTTQGYKWKWE